MIEEIITYIQEAIASRNIVAWLIILVLFFVIFKILKSLGKTFVVLLLIGLAVFALSRVFPDLVTPITEFIQGSWMNSNRQL